MEGSEIPIIYRCSKVEGGIEGMKRGFGEMRGWIGNKRTSGHSLFLFPG